MTASPTTPAAVASAPTAVTTATTPGSAAAAAFSLRPRFVYHQVPAAEVLTVQGIDRAFGIFVSLHFDEGKATRLSRETVTNEIDTRGSNTDLRKPFLKLFFRGGKRKIPDV